MRQLTEYEDWLYDEGEDCEKNVYKDKLELLKLVSHCISLMINLKVIINLSSGYTSFISNLFSLFSIVAIFPSILNIDSLILSRLFIELIVEPSLI